MTDLTLLGWVALAKSTCVPLAFASVHAQSLARDRVEDIPARNHKTATMIGQSRERIEGTGIALQNGDGRKTNSPKTDQTLSRTWGFPRTDVFLLPTHASTDQ